jgi:malonyl-CoA O-methyltransferase
LGFPARKRDNVALMLNTKHIRRRFERIASRFDEADFVHAATRDGLLARLEPLLIDAKTVLDLGAATGTATRLLAKRFKRSHVISIDLAHTMLHAARTKKAWLSKTSYAQANAWQLPFETGSIDVVFANQLLPWIDNPGPVFAEIARVLRKGGLFAFATLGPDSLQEIRRAWSEVDENHHVNRFLDMHDLGDGLVNAGLRDPVLDVDRLAVQYESSDALFRDLTTVGARNSLQARTSGLTGKGRFNAMKNALGKTAVEGKITMNLELVFGHCWGAGPKKDPANYAISPAEIGIRRT